MIGRPISYQCLWSLVKAPVTLCVAAFWTTGWPVHHHGIMGIDWPMRIGNFVILNQQFDGWWPTNMVLVGGWPTPLKNKNISQLGLLFPAYGKIKNVPNHQPVVWLENAKASWIHFCLDGWIEPNKWRWKFLETSHESRAILPYDNKTSWINRICQGLSKFYVNVVYFF